MSTITATLQGLPAGDANRGGEVHGKWEYGGCGRGQREVHLRARRSQALNSP